MISARIALIVFATLLASCAAPTSGPQSTSADGLQPAVLFSNSDIVVRLVGSKNQPRMTSRCWLYIRLENISDRDQKPAFNMLLLNKDGNTLKEGVLNFPTVLPKKSFDSTHYTFTDWTCNPIATVKLTPIKQ